jgi:phosphoserine phosphatase
MNEFISLSIIGKDRPGILDSIVSGIERSGAQIVDVQQHVSYGILNLFFLLKGDEYKIRKELFIEGSDISFDIHRIEPIYSPSGKRFVLTAIGKSSPSLLRSISSTTGRLGINNLSINMLTRGELTALQFLMDFRECNEEEGRKELLRVISSQGVDAVIEPEESFRIGKKLIVFDMDSTLIDAETLDELAKITGMQDEVKRITEKAMRGELDYTESLRLRVSMLKGLHVSVLERLRSSLELTAGAEELISTLRSMKYRIAVVSGGFTFFTDWIKEKLHLDYAFGNRLEIKDGYLTGRLEEPVIDAAGKQRIIEELILSEHITPEEVVVVGDGANDTVMVRNAGLGIAFRGKEILREVADGSISKTDLRALLFCLGN